MRVIPVDDADDPRLVELTGLTDAAARAITEADHGCFVVEGIVALETAVSSAHRLRSVLVADRKLERVRSLVDGIDTDVFVGSPVLLEAVTGFPIHRGVVASAERVPLPAPTEVLQGARRVAVLEGITDHENIGAIFRNAAAFGIDAVLLDPRTADPLYRRSVRVSLGHVMRVPWTRLPDLPAGLDVVTDAGLRTVALTPRGEVDVRALAFDGPVAWILGTEGPGLTGPTMAAADTRARITMAGEVDSLNVATAAAVAFALTTPP